MTPAHQYFVGIGAQKSGTTWLARYLQAHPQVGLGPIKEYHYWTSKFTDHQRYAVWGRHGLPGRVRALLGQMRRAPRLTPALLVAFAGMMAHRDPSYRRLLDLGAGPDVTIAGEITPAYATLPDQGFAAIDACLDAPKYILMLRNPVDRFISQITQEAKTNRAVRRDPEWTRWIDTPRFALRSDYVQTLRTCAQLVPRDRVHIVFFEDLFDPEIGQSVCDGICDFLGVSHRPGNLQKRENIRRFERPRFDRSQVLQRLQPNYVHLDRLYGDSLPATWRDDIKTLQTLGHWPG